MPPVGFEPTISEGERTQTYALDRAATETDMDEISSGKKKNDFYNNMGNSMILQI